MALPRALDECTKLQGTLAHVLFVEHALRQAAEEARHAVFEDAAAWREQGRTRRYHGAELQQIVLVAAGAVQEQERRRTGPGSGLKAIDE